MSTPSRAVYRALVGRYEQLREEPLALETDIPFICITDDPDLKSDTWTIVLDEPRLSGDLPRSSRAAKILGHPCLEDFEQTLWIDNTVELRRPPDELFDAWLGDAEVAVPLHSYRSSILGEAEAVIDAGLDDFARVYEQLTHYLRTQPEVLEENPRWLGMIVRRRGAAAEAMRSWWDHLLRYSRRDQLSFLPAMRRFDVDVRSFPLDHHESPWHVWHGDRPRDVAGLSSGLREALRPPAGRIGQLEQALDAAARNVAALEADRAEQVAVREEIMAAQHRSIEELQDQLRAAHQRTAEAERALAAEVDRVARLRSRVHRLRSRLEQASRGR